MTKTLPSTPENKQKNCVFQSRNQAEKLSRKKTGKLCPEEQKQSRKTQPSAAGNPPEERPRHVLVENQFDKSRKLTEKLTAIDQKTSRKTEQKQNRKTQPSIPENKQENLARQSRKQAGKLSRKNSEKDLPSRPGNKQKNLVCQSRKQSEKLSRKKNRKTLPSRPEN